MECRINEINFLIFLAWAGGSRDMGDPILKIKKGCEGFAQKNNFVHSTFHVSSLGL